MSRGIMYVVERRREASAGGGGGTGAILGANGWDLTNIATAPNTPPDVTDHYVQTNEVGLNAFPAGFLPPLTRQTGTFTTSYAGQIVYGMDLDNVVMAHANCIFVGCRIRGRIDGRIDCHVWGCDWGRTSPGDSNLNGMRYVLGSVRACNVFGFTDLGQIHNESGITMLWRDNVMHDNSVVTDTGQSGGISHNDGLQVVSAGGNLSVIHNTAYMWSFYAKGGESCTADGPGPHWNDYTLQSTAYSHGWMNSFMLINSGAGIHDVLIEDNWIDGLVAAYIHVAYPTYDVTNIKIKGNKFGSGCVNAHYPTGTPISGPKGVAWDDDGVSNTFIENGAVIPHT